MSTTPLRLLASALLCAVLVGACSGDDDADGSTSPTETTAATTGTESSTPSIPGATTTGTSMPDGGGFGVGVRTETFIDTARRTPPSGDQPGADARVLETLVFYPADADPVDGAVADAEPATGRAPYPLVVFAHGLGGTPEFSQPLIERWVRAGFVVVAPRFPLSRPDNPAGPDGGDVQNQPGDVRFLIDELTGASADPDSPLAGLIDPERIGASGHSNGAITTLGVTLHTCCVDERIDAAVEFAGTAAPFAGGEYDWTLAPPYLIVHGTEDQLVSYGNGVALFNQLDGPKGMLTLDGGDHGAMFVPGSAWFDEVVEVTTEFWRAYLTDDAAALERLAAGSASSDPDLRFVAEEGAADVIPTTTMAGVDRRATVEPTQGLVDGQRVTVTWSGFTPEGTVNVVQCADADAGASFCDLTTGQILVPNPTGTGALELEIVVGPVGDGTCGPGISGCVIAVNDSGLTEPEATIYVPLVFAE